jgi:PPIC-type PPIASE domain/SurA N-terminal domain
VVCGAENSGVYNARAMKLITLPLLAVGVSLLGSTAVLGCGDGGGLPDDAVAEVGDTVITKSDFDSALRFATGRGNDPRDYAACAAAKRRGGGEGAQPREAELEKQCREEYQQTKRTVMAYLIKAEWTRQEAEARGIVVTDAQVEKLVDRGQQVGLFNPSVLRTARVSKGELYGRVRYNQLSGKISEQMRDEARKVSAQDIARYYRRNRADLTVPYRRDARIVIAKSRARAGAARDALRAGRSWKSVAKEYSLHFSRNHGGKIEAEWKHPDEGGLGGALFRARSGELTGPVGNGDTWAVFVADKMERSYRPTLDQARDDITERLRRTQGKQALGAYTKKYRDKTTCAPGFEVTACKNGPEPTKDQPTA